MTSNIYDLSSLAVLSTKGYRLGLWRMRRRRLFQILTLAAAVFTCGMLFFTIARDDYEDGMLKCWVLLYGSTVTFTGLFINVINRIDILRLSRKEIQERHDYNYALYGTLYRKNSRLRSVVLLQMARQQIQMRHPQTALQALEFVEREPLNVAQLRSFYFYHGTALYLDFQKGWQEELEKCYAIPEKRNQMSRDEIQKLFQAEDNPEQLMQAVENWEKQKQAWPIVTLAAAVLILYTGVYYGVNGLLPRGYNYRDWVITASVGVLFFGWTALSLYWLVKMLRLFGTLSESGKARIFLGRALLILIWSCFFLWNGLFQFLSALGTDSEVEVQDQGIIVMRHENWLDSSEYYYNKKVGLFLRRYLSYEEFLEYGLDESNLPGTAYLQRNSENDSNAVSETAGQSGNPADDASDGTEQVPSDSESPLLTQARNVYIFMQERGDIQSMGDASEITASCNAKGNFYAVFESGEDEETSWENRLVYDRTSRNGACELFVYEREETGKDTKILGFYAVNKTTGEVISGEKTTWSEVGSKAYREATGE